MQRSGSHRKPEGSSAKRRFLPFLCIAKRVTVRGTAFFSGAVNSNCCRKGAREQKKINFPWTGFYDKINSIVTVKGETVMKAYFYKEGLWTGRDSFWQALGLDRRRHAAGYRGDIAESAGDKGGTEGDGTGTAGDKAAGPLVISLTGAGGKTSTIRRLAYEAGQRGWKVLVVTTTHMACPEDFGIFADDIPAAAMEAAVVVKKAVSDCLRQRGLAVVGRRAPKGKIAFIGQELYREICPLADLVLVEADGSRRLPLKAPGDGEPVIPANSDLILCLSGLSCLGQRAGDCCLRLEQARALMDLHGRKEYGEDGWLIRPEDMMCLMKHGYLDPLRGRWPAADVVPIFNQADTPEDVKLVREMLDGMGEGLGIASGHLADDRSEGLF